MFQLFYKYLILYRRADVPGLGVFFIERTPAKLDVANKVFIAPISQINFRAQTPVADNRMYTFISRQEKIDESEAVIRFNNFANTIRKKLDEHKSIELPGLGVLLQNDEGNLYFKAISELNDYFPPAVADRVLRENTEQTTLVGANDGTNGQLKEMFVEEPKEPSHVKDYWWKFAIALGIIGIAGILYYYFSNGNLQ
jgi:hypothetical protein